MKRTFVLVGTILLISLTACTRTVEKITVVTPTPALADTPKSLPLATPYAQEPAAGICASFETEMVTVTINPDIPDPRCSKVSADQKLTVVNQTGGTIGIIIGRFIASIQPGAEYTIDTPFGEYLAPGVHQLQVSPCCGAELWLETPK